MGSYDVSFIKKLTPDTPRGFSTTQVDEVWRRVTTFLSFQQSNIVRIKSLNDMFPEDIWRLEGSNGAFGWMRCERAPSAQGVGVCESEEPLGGWECPKWVLCHIKCSIYKLAMNVGSALLCLLVLL
jgi:hypothetical protein